MSKLQITNFKLQTLGSILVPIFLFTAIPQAITDQELVEVTFQIKSPEYNQAVFSDYSLDASYLFQNLYKKEIIPSGGNSDDNGHGTAVAGVVGAIPNNQKGIAGVNWNFRLMPVKTLA